MNKSGLLLGITLSAAPLAMFGQMSNSIKLNEVMTNNAASIQDEYGRHKAWIEIANISHSTYDVRGMYLTTDRSVLSRDMSVPERMKRMCPIPSGDGRTNLTARQHITFFCNSNPAQGTLHLALEVDPTKPTWIALYNGNATELIDSVTVPVLEADQSYARQTDGSPLWEVKTAADVTPDISNGISSMESKVAKLKRDDPYGLGITALSMGIVFFCLALLYAFFSLFGLFVRHRTAARKVASIQPLKAGVDTVEKTVEIGHRTNVMLRDGIKTRGIDRETYMAVISLAIQQYIMNTHDVESGIITIKPKDTNWNEEYIQMTHFHE